MTVICPACDARFRDPPADVPLTRPLQCGVCEHEWLRTDAPRIKMDAPSLAPDFDDLAEPDSVIKTALPVIVPGEGVIDKTTQPAQPRMPIFVDREQPSAPKFSFKKPAIALACAFVLIAAGAVSGRTSIMSLFPQTQGLYEFAGLHSPTSGLKIANVKSTRSTDEGIRRLIVRGEIENHAASSMSIPPIKLIVRGQGDAELYAWTVAASQKELDPGKSGRFTAIAVDYPSDAVDVEVAFAPEKTKDAR